MTAAMPRVQAKLYSLYAMKATKTDNCVTTQAQRRQDAKSYLSFEQKRLRNIYISSAHPVTSPIPHTQHTPTSQPSNIFTQPYHTTHIAHIPPAHHMRHMHSHIPLHHTHIRIHRTHNDCNNTIHSAYADKSEGGPPPPPPPTKKR